MASILFAGCSKERLDFPQPSFGENGSAQVEVPDQSYVDASARDHRIFADMGSYFSGTPSSTKASGTPESLEDLLDRSKTNSLDLGSNTLTEIPFKDEYSRETANVSFSCPEFFNADTVSIVKMSLVDWKDNATDEHNIFVVTMIPYSDFDSDRANSDYSFISSLATFRGLLLFSEPDGTYVGSYEYLEGEFLGLLARNPLEEEDGTMEGAFISFPAIHQPGTKVCDKVELEWDEIFCFDIDPAYCIDNRNTGGGGSSYISDRGSSVNSLLNGAGQYGSTECNSYGGSSGGANKGTSLKSRKEAMEAEEAVKELATKLKGNAQYLDKVKKALETHCKEIVEVRNLLSRLSQYSDKITQIEIKETAINNGTGTDAITVSLNNGCYRIEIEYVATDPSGVNAPALYEELLHVLQYCAEEKKWKAGDMELEAKVFLSVLYEKYKLYYGVDKKYSDKFYNYYKSPSDKNYEAVKDVLYGLPFRYSKESFPITENMSHPERLKHIKK